MDVRHALPTPARKLVLLVAWLCAPALQANEDSRPEILIMDLQHSEDVKPDVARTLTELVTSEVSSREGVRTLAGADIRNMLELEGEKQAMGCDIDASCLAEVANAMGARFVVFGRVSTLGGLIVLTMNMLDAERSQALARTTVQASSLDKLVPELPGAVDKLLKKPMEIWDKENAARAAKAAVASSETGSERAAAEEKAALAAADAERARTTTDVSKVEVAPEPAAEVAADEGGGLAAFFRYGGLGVVAVGTLAGAFVVVSGVAIAYGAALNPDEPNAKNREVDREVAYVATAFGVLVATIVTVVGGALLGVSFLVE
jgi:hypothetical protein